MDTFPKSIFEFQNRFGTEEQCAAELAKLRWPNGFLCPNCGHDDGRQLTGRREIQCALCRHQTSVTSGTIFHRTHLPLVCWFWIIYQVAHDKGGASATRLASQLNRPYKTIWHVLHKIRYAMGSRDSRITLAGLIEMDEALLGPEARRPAKDDDDPNPEVQRRKPRKKPWGAKPRDRGKRKTITEVLILVEAERFHAGNVAMHPLQNKHFDTLREVIQEKVDEGQWFRTDAHHTHWVLRQVAEKFSIKKSDEAMGCEALPVVHRVISLLKHFLMGTYFGVSVKYLAGYLKEFCFRFMRREKEHTLSYSLLRACAFALPVTYAELKL